MDIITTTGCNFTVRTIFPHQSLGVGIGIGFGTAIAIGIHGTAGSVHFKREDLPNPDSGFNPILEGKIPCLAASEECYNRPIIYGAQFFR